VRSALAVAASATSGVLLWLSAPPVGVGLLAWIALVPAAVVALRAPETRHARLAVPLAYAVYLELLIVPALPFGIARRQWGDPVIPVLVGDSPVLAAALVGVPLVGLTLYALRFPQLVALPGLVATLALPPLAWTALDVVRTKFDPSGLWGPLFLSQHDTSARGIAALGGPWLVTSAIVAVNYVLALVVVRGREAVRPAAFLATIVVAIQTVPGDGGSVRVAAVQPGYDTSEFERPVLRYFGKNDELAGEDMVFDLRPLTREAERRGADVVVWPEATIWVDPARTQPGAAITTWVLRGTDVRLVVPYFARERAEGAAFVVSRAGGEWGGPQPKRRPMWFLGEKGADRADPSPVDAEGIVIGTMLGVDNQDPGVARALVAAGADLLTSSTHDWSELTPQQQASTQLHAAALGVPVVRADWRYGSAVFDAGGRRVAHAGGAKRRTVVVGDVTLRDGETLYARIGDAFAWLAVVGAVAAVVGARLLSLVRRRASGG
jgi:apolipoprotein N-acyltransferase